MSTESRLILTNISTEAAGISDKKPGAGYYKLSNPLHTLVYVVNAFRGTIKMQGTLALYPSDADWFDIPDTDYGDGSTIDTENTSFSTNFTGNFVWIRAVYTIEDGTIVSIRYNY